MRDHILKIATNRRWGYRHEFICPGLAPDCEALDTCPHCPHNGSSGPRRVTMHGQMHRLCGREWVVPTGVCILQSDTAWGDLAQDIARESGPGIYRVRLAFNADGSHYLDAAKVEASSELQDAMSVIRSVTSGGDRDA